MPSQLSTSLIISTYNRPEALKLCLHSILIQRQLPDEVLVADDGSTEATKTLIDEFRKQCQVSVKHIWHDDNGFRLAKIRNEALVNAKGDYIIQIDGDIIMHPYFIKDHKQFAKKKTIVRASRIYLDDALTKKVIAQDIVKINLLQKGISNKTSALHLPFLWSRFETNYKNKGAERYEIHGCNMAYWKDDAFAVNGYNEDFLGWGPEDKEFVVRLLNYGCQKRFLKMGGIAFHLYHLENNKPFLKKNEYLMRTAIEDQLTVCKNGIKKY